MYLIEILHQTTTNVLCVFKRVKLYLIEILHQTTTADPAIRAIQRCILSKFYIKPQQNPNIVSPQRVVSYRNSTSNHNRPQNPVEGDTVVSYRNSTSNHNTHGLRLLAAVVVSYRNSTSNHNIEPFPSSLFWLYLIEILHQTTTLACVLVRKQPLYLIEILHQTTTSGLILIDKVLLTGCLPL